MTQKLFWFTSIVALLITVVTGLKTVNATDYHIGSEQQFASLEAFRLAMESQGKYGASNAHLQDGDVLILHENDYSLTKMLFVGYNATVTIKSSDTEIQREISPALGAKTRLFYLDGTGYYMGSTELNQWSRINFDGISKISGGYAGYDVDNGYDLSSGGGGAIYAWWHNYINNLDVRGITFEDNFSRIDQFYGAGGGAIYYWDALDCDLTDASFINNKSEGPGGALYINASTTLYMGNNTTNITIGASEGKIATFKGNLDYVEVDNLGNYVQGTGTPNSIDFTGSTGKKVNLFIRTAQDGILDMKDPFRTNQGDGEYTVNIEKTGLGTWKLGGNSIINGSSGTTVSIKEGTLELYNGASLNAAGYNDEFNVSINAKVLIHGDNTITGTRVLFQPGAFLTFDLSYYFPNDYPAPTTPMLNLSGNTLQVSGTRIDITGLPNDDDDRRNGDYVLIQGTSTLEIGDFNLWIGNANIDVSGRVSKRFGYSLGYGHDSQDKINDKQLVLSISDTDNTVLKWIGGGYNQYWSVIGENWTLIRPEGPINDSFIPGDTVQFFGSGNHTITLLETVAIGHNTVTDLSGKTWYGNSGDITGMHVSDNGNWTFTGNGGITDTILTGPAALLFDGTGTLTLANNTANTYSGGTNLAGTGTLNVTRGDLLGIGNVHFLNNGAQDTSKLNVTGTATLNQQLIAETGSNGLVTVDKTKNLTIHRIVDTTDSIDNAVDSAVYVKTGGQLKIQAQPQGRYGNIIFSENGTKNDGSLLEKGSAAFVEYGGQLEMDGVTVSKNKVQTGGGIIYNEGNTIIRSGIFSENIGSAVRASGNSKTEIFDSTFTKNSTDGNGAAVYYQGSNGNNSSLTISATAGKMTLFSDNHAETKTETGTVANSIHLTAVNNGTANLIIDTHKDTKSGAEGIVDMLDPISSDNGNYTINVTKTGEGTWKLAGNNELKSTNGTFQITNGIVDLYKEGKIEITNGTFSIDAAGTLNSRGENSVTAKMISFADGATLGFDLTESKSVTEPEGSPALLNLNTNSLNFNRTKIDLLELSSQSESGYGIFNLLTTDTLISDSTVVSLELQYHGQDMKQFRQQFGVLKTTNDGKTLQVEITKTDNGTTQWTNKSENLQWDATSHNWHGISQNISTTTQFLDGDTIIFTDNGAGKITIIDGGVNIAGMTVDNSAGEKNDYVFQGGSISPVTGKKDSGLLKKGSGTVTFTQENYFEGGTIIEGGKVVANKISSLGTGDIVFKNNNDDAALEFNLDGQSSGVLEQKIIGETGNRGQLIKSGSGSLTLKNQNTYGGETIIRGGTLIAEGLDTLGSGNIITGDETGHGTMVLNLAKDEVFTKEISGTGSLKTAGTGTLTLTQENNYSGGTTIESGTAIFAQNINSLGTGDIRNDGKLTLDLASDGILKQSMSGIGSFEKRGNGLLELTQANTFSGKTILTAGTLRLKNESALQNSVLDYQNGNLDIGNLNRLKLGGIAGTQNLLLNNSSGQAVALTVGADNQDTVPVYNGNITGTGNVTKIGGGIQKFAGQNTYSGGTTISDGRLVSIGISGFGTGNIVNNAEMEFEINANNEETYEKTISGTGSLWKSGSGTLTLVGKNTYEGETIIENGRIAVSSIESLGRISEKGYEESAVVMRNENASLLLDFNENVTFSRTINGTGSVYKTGNGILTLEKDLNLNGSTHVLAGTLFVNAEAKTATTVYDGATLGGDGFINNSVTFRNGSSQIIGQNENAKLTTFTAKNINYENGSTVYIKVGQNGSDQVIAKDGFNFAKGGGVVNVVLLNLGLDDFDPETAVSPTDYTIFVADAGKLLLNGKHISNTESDSDTLTVEGKNGEIRFLAEPEEGLGVLGYSVKTDDKATRSISLSLAAVSPAAVAYLNTNQREVLKGITDADIFDGIYAYNKQSRGNVIDQTMPMIQTAMPFLTERSVTQFNIAAFDRLRFLREPLALTDREINAYRGSSHRLAHIHSRNNYLWFQNYGDFIRMSAGGGVPEFQANSYGFSVGVDKGIDYHSSVGLGMGGYFSDLNANDVYQKGDIGSYLISLYGNWINDDNWMITGSTGFVFSSYELTRNAPTFNTTLKSRHCGTTLFASVEGSRKILFGKYEVSPHLGADFIWLGEEGYREHATTGLQSLALNIKSQDTFTVLSTVGIRLGRSMRLMGGNIVNPSLYAAWIHDWTESNITTTASFFGEPSFKIRGASMNRDRAQLGANLNMTLNKRTDMFARFNAELATRYSDLSFHLGIRFGF